MFGIGCSLMIWPAFVLFYGFWMAVILESTCQTHSERVTWHHITQKFLPYSFIVITIINTLDKVVSLLKVDIEIPKTKRRNDNLDKVFDINLPAKDNHAVYSLHFGNMNLYLHKHLIMTFTLINLNKRSISIVLKYRE